MSSVDLADAIADKLRRAFRKLGAKPEELDGFDWDDKEAVTVAAHALAPVSSCSAPSARAADTLSDDQVLRYLQAVNGRGTIFGKVISEGE